MAEPPSWNNVYEGSPPWDIGEPQPEFVKLADAGKLQGRILDVGCGSGEQVILAARHGAEAMGVDISELAIERARAKAEEPGDWGPRRVSQAELRVAFADGWSIGSIEAVKFAIAIDSSGAKAWLARIEHL